LSTPHSSTPSSVAGHSRRAPSYHHLDDAQQEVIQRMAQRVLATPQSPQSSPPSVVPQTQASPAGSVVASPAVVTTANDLTLERNPMAFLKMTVTQQVSDIHLRVGFPPILRRNGDMYFTKAPAVTAAHIFAFMQQLINPDIYAQLTHHQDLDFSFEVPQLARFRVNWLHEMDRPAVVLRLIKSTIPAFEELGLPEVLKSFTNLHKGLVLVTGPTGSGKTTTLASLLNLINQQQSKHLITLEDPIEFVYKSDQSVITQRQLGHDTATFAAGIKYSLRQDPDVILVGEMRDRETIEAAMMAAETGHLVFSTLHTNDAVQTITRIINQFQPHEREAVRLQLASILMGTVAQRLARRSDGRGRVAINEIMTVTSTVKDYIERNEIDAIYQLLSNSRSPDMVSLNAALMQAYQRGDITQDEAMACSQQPHELTLLLRGAGSTAY
jgi:twitching motility protein PilT